MNRKSVYTCLNAMSFIFLLVTSFLVKGSTAFMVAGVEPLIMPAAYAFLIWIVIYALWFIWIIRYGFKSKQEDKVYERVSRFLPLSLACAGGSLLVGQPGALLFIFGSWITAVFMYLSCQHGIKKPSFFRIPLSVYLGWVSVALILEISIVLLSQGMTHLFGLPEMFWAIFILMFAGFIAISFNSINQDFLYPLVLIWAYIAIAIKHLQLTPIFVTCCGVILIIALVMDRVKRRIEK